MKEDAMRPSNGPEAPPARPGIGLGLGVRGTLVLAAAIYVSQAYLGDSPYWIQLTHRPLAVALWAAVSLVDWSHEVKVIVVLGASLPVMLDSGRRLLRGRPAWPAETRPRTMVVGRRAFPMGDLETAR
jgi:hypothetical protein